MAPVWRQILVITLLLPQWAGADEAVTHQGRRYPGTLRQQDFLLAGTERHLPLEQIHLVQFPRHPTPLPHCRLLNQLLFPGEQRLAGELLTVEAKDIRFRSAGGETFALSRRQVQGIVQADDYLTQWAEDFEDNKNTLSWSGKPILSEEHAFSGRKSLLVDATSHDVGVVIGASQKPKAPYRATLCFFDAGPRAGTGARVDFIFQAREAGVTISLDLKSHYSRDHSFQLKASRGWHLLQVDWSGGEARVYIDDYFLTRQTMPENARLASCRFSFEGPGGMWFDSLQLSAKAPLARRTPGPPELDEVWLASGDQVFGAVRQADAHGVVLEAGFGKRTFAWSQVRGIFFRAEPNPPAAPPSVEVRFRSAPGLSPDQLTGTIVDLNERALLLQHPVLGKLAIARTRLDQIRFPAPAAK